MSRWIGFFLVVMSLLVAAPVGAKDPPKAVDLNRATVEELMRLPGIGRRRAEAIVTHRQARPFRRPVDIMRLRGFGRQTFKRLRPYLTVTPPPETP